MTGGQPLDGTLSVPQLTFSSRRSRIESRGGVRNSGALSRCNACAGHAVESRSKLQEVETGLRDVPGTTVIIYDQTCATEKRRRRKRGELPDPGARVFINDRVCEDAVTVRRNPMRFRRSTGDGIRPQATDRSIKLQQRSFVHAGICPSFVTVRGASFAVRDPMKRRIPRKVSRSRSSASSIRHSTWSSRDRRYRRGDHRAILGMAAHMEQKAITVLDSLGFSQKGGGVTTQIKLANSNAEIPSLKISDGKADLLLACDNLLAPMRKCSSCFARG